MRLVFAAVLAVALALSAASASARMRLVEPGEVPRLDADEGLVVMAVDTDVPLRTVSVNKDDKFFGSGVMSRLDPGRTYRLYVADAGDYEWEEVRLLRQLKMKLHDDPEFDFRVEPGRITYPGDLLFRPVTLFRAEVAVPNRSLAALDWLAQAHPALLAAHGFAYVGHYPDPFPAHYRALLAAHPGFVPQGDIHLLPPPAPGPLPLAVDQLWKEGRVSDVALNPQGTLLAMQVRLEGDEHVAALGGEETWAVDLVDIDAGTLTRIAQNALPYETLEWGGEDVLLLTMELPRETRVAVVRAPVDAQGRRSVTYWPIERDGSVLDPLPGDPDHILFAHESRDGRLRVHRMDISSEAAIAAFSPRMRDRLNVGVEDDLAWITDGSGRLRLAIARRDEQYVLMHEQDGAFVQVMVLSDEIGFTPVGLSHDANLIYGLTDEDRSQRDVVAYDVRQRRITGTVFSRPGVDVVSLLQDAQRRPIGVTHYEQGRLVSTYFDEGDQRFAGLLAEAFPNRTVATVERSVDGRRSVIWVDAADQPPQLYFVDAAAGRAMLLEESMPWLDGVAFAPTVVVPFSGPDGLRMEAFLTLPPGDASRPLVVMPHGGPVGIADRRHFDPEVQFLASLGYAVLRVNFRGSEGYGRAFREAGHRNWGTLIEDDIDAAIDEVVARHPVDAGRMCMVGASYGGYSGLVSAMRWPDRFRCVVAIAGVTDRILQFTSSDTGRSAEGRELLERLMGDPDADLEAMMATSPTYHHDRITVPVMLVHGREDRRVDHEHTRRMARLLELAGRPATGLVFDEEGHGIRDADNIETLWHGVAGFLAPHLGPAPAAPR